MLAEAQKDLECEILCQIFSRERFEQRLRTLIEEPEKILLQSWGWNQKDCFFAHFVKGEDGKIRAQKI